MKEKTTDKMNFEEFNQWANEHVVAAFLDHGLRGIKDSLWMVVSQAQFNQVWGGSKKTTKKGK